MYSSRVVGMGDVGSQMGRRMGWYGVVETIYGGPQNS